jgi:hypothetical protein
MSIVLDYHENSISVFLRLSEDANDQKFLFIPEPQWILKILYKKVIENGC